VGLAVVTRIPSYVEAQIAAGALRSGGIDAQVFDGNFGQVEAPVIEALGGFRIMAPEAQLASAKEILAELRASPGLDDSDDSGPWAASLAGASRSRAKRTRLWWSLAVGIGGLVWLVRMLAQS
jgi:Putative prokaryotic signal transducing protein